MPPHNKPTNSEAFKVRDMTTFLLCQKGALWLGGSDGKMFPATGSSQPLEPLVSNVYPLMVALCSWSVVYDPGQPSPSIANCVPGE